MRIRGSALDLACAHAFLRGKRRVSFLAPSRLPPVWLQEGARRETGGRQQGDRKETGGKQEGSPCAHAFLRGSSLSSAKGVRLRGVTN